MKKLSIYLIMLVFIFVGCEKGNTSQAEVKNKMITTDEKFCRSHICRRLFLVLGD